MIKKILLFATVIFMTLYAISWIPTPAAAICPLPADSSIVVKGEVLFNQYCSGCHNFRQDAIGPQLAGLASKVSVQRMQKFIKNPKSVIEAGDERAQALYKKYKVFMPSFAHLKEEELNAIIAFINTHKVAVKKVFKRNGNELSNPIRDTIKPSDLVVGLKLVTQIPASSDDGKFPLARITKLVAQPKTGNLFILDLRGKLYKLLDNNPVVYMDMAKLKPKFTNQPGLGTGFGSFAFHPDFVKNGLLYTTHTEDASAAKADFAYADSIKIFHQWVLTEWKAADPAAAVFSGKGRELIRVNVVSNIHGMQEITFNPYSKPGSDDYGLLYIGLGDGGCVENDYAFLAHSPEKIWGTILRIDPTGKNGLHGRYGIPISNPFASNKNGKVLREIYAYGFRNPHRITWTMKNQMMVSNIGHGNIESINLIEKGHDYGWPVREGTFLLNPYGDLNAVYPLPKNDSSFHITYPVVQYDHDEGKAITGGYEYTGKSIPALKGKFLFGDIPSGRLFYVDIADIKQGRQATIKEWKFSIDGELKSFAAICPDKRIDLHFGKDAQGELFVLTKSDGKVYKMVSAEHKGVQKL